MFVLGPINFFCVYVFADDADTAHELTVSAGFDPDTPCPADPSELVEHLLSDRYWGFTSILINANGMVMAL